MNIQVKRSMDCRGIIEKCYPSDSELIEKYHVLAPTTVEKAIEHTAATLGVALHSGALTMYELSVKGKFAGYFGVEKIKDMWALTGMFVMPEFRTPEFLKKYMKIIKSKFDGRIFTYLYQKNLRAISFIKKNGFKMIATTEYAGNPMYAFKLN